MKKRPGKIGSGDKYFIIVILAGTAYRVGLDIVGRVNHGFLPQQEFVEQVTNMFKPGQNFGPIDPRAKPVRIIFHKGDAPAGFLQKMQQIIRLFKEGRSIAP